MQLYDVQYVTMCQPFYLITLYHSQRTRIAFLFLVHISGYDYVRDCLCPLLHNDIVMGEVCIGQDSLVAVSEHHGLERTDT